MINENNLEDFIPMIQEAFKTFTGIPAILNIEVLDKSNSILKVSGINNQEAFVMLPLSSDNHVINVMEIDNGDNGDVTFSACVKAPYWQPYNPDGGDAGNVAFALTRIMKVPTL